MIEQPFAANGGSKRVRKAEFWQIGQSDLNRPFSEILQRGDQGKWLKRRPNLRAWKTARRKWSSLLINMRLKCNNRATFFRKRRLQKCPQSGVLANWAK